MGFSCPICSEKLDKLPAEGQTAGQFRGEVNISATPCGHIFHAYCIQKWLTGNLASSKQCPCCRKPVPKLRCLSLFPNVTDDTILDDSLSQPFPEAPVCNHGELINSLKNQITRNETELREKDQLYTLLSADYETLHERFRKEKLESDMWMMKAKQYESLQDAVENWQSRADVAEKKVKQYAYIENTLKGIQVPVNQELSKTSINSETVKNLLEAKFIIQSEFRNESKKCIEWKNKYENIRVEKMKLRVDYESTKKELKELKRIYELTRINGRRDNDSTSPPFVGSSTVSMDETPKAFRAKRRMQVSLSVLPDPNSPAVDSDVDVFPSAIKVKKPKATSLEVAKKKHIKQETTKPSKFPCTLSPISSSSQSQSTSSSAKTDSSKNETITLDDSSNDELLDLEEQDDEDDFKIRGNVPGAPLPLDPKRIQSLKARSENPVLGGGIRDTHIKKKFKFTKR